MIASTMEHKNKTPLSLERMSPERQFRLFVQAMFEPDDLVEIRAIESAPSGSKSAGAVVLREWSVAKHLVEEFSRLAELNQQGANLYFGVNPRDYRSGKKQAVTKCRVLWADLDDCTFADARERWRNQIPEPSIVVNSGHGVHLYWTLDHPAFVRDPKDQGHLEASLKSLYRDLRSDMTQDITRLLRLPGFFNMKNSPVPCRLEQFTPSVLHSFSDFRHWQDLATETLMKPGVHQNADRPMDRLDSENISVSETVDVKRIRGVVAALDRDVDDRSRRDFWVVCRLLQIGLSPDEIQPLVAGKSKFTTDQYIQLTVQKAIEAMSHS